mmetsp:Transcript_22357/g.40199  ORF Transcript_22357/g.40199 Transcript_22357/m.40199 type:complete len:310 (+) Transcript_22357:2521-3450(+)
MLSSQSSCRSFLRQSRSRHVTWCHLLCRWPCSLSTSGPTYPLRTLLPPSSAPLWCTCLSSGTVSQRCCGWPSPHAAPRGSCCPMSFRHCCGRPRWRLWIQYRRRSFPACRRHPRGIPLCHHRRPLPFPSWSCCPVSSGRCPLMQLRLLPPTSWVVYIMWGPMSCKVYCHCCCKPCQRTSWLLPRPCSEGPWQRCLVPRPSSQRFFHWFWRPPPRAPSWPCRPDSWHSSSTVRQPQGGRGSRLGSARPLHHRSWPLSFLWFSRACQPPSACCCPSTLRQSCSRRAPSPNSCFRCCSNMYQSQWERCWQRN